VPRLGLDPAGVAARHAPKVPDVEFEGPTCEKCGWAGDPVPMPADRQAYADNEIETPPPGEPGPPAEPFISPKVRRASC
jgi:hypothetical protein